MSDTPSPFENAAPIPLPRVVAFVRQVTHDVRNGLSAMDLQAAYLAEIAPNGEIAEEIGKLRTMVSHVTKDMQELSCRFGEVRPMTMEYPLEEFMNGLREMADEELETHAKRIVWEVRGGEEELEMDYNLLQSALIELARNAINFREGDEPIHVTARTGNGTAVFEVRQSRKQPVTGESDWGRAPLDSSRRGGYGLGLFYVRRILDKLGGMLQPAYDPESGELTVRLTLPLKQAVKT
jgi:signal transduction histidine kinase